MISYLRGVLAAVEEDKVVIDVGGVGYGVYMSGHAMGKLPPIGREVKIHTYLNVKEDAMQLYGFLTRDDLSVKMLWSISRRNLRYQKKRLYIARYRVRQYRRWWLLDMGAQSH